MEECTCPIEPRYADLQTGHLKNCPRGKELRYREDNSLWHGYEVTDSSNVEYVGWAQEGMLVRFKGGALYLYKGVSRQRAVATARAESVGKYINRTIKPNYEVVRLAT